MGLLLLLLLAIVLTGAICAACSYREDKVNNFWVGVIFTGTLSVIFLVIVIGTSYENYMGLKIAQANIGQYEQEIELYTRKGVTEFAKAINTETTTITDLKFQAYQTELSAKLKALRQAVTDYNKVLVGKRTVAETWFYGLLIIEPDPDMKVLNLAEL